LRSVDCGTGHTLFPSKMHIVPWKLQRNAIKCCPSTNTSGWTESSKPLHFRSVLADDEIPVHPENDVNDVWMK